MLNICLALSFNPSVFQAESAIENSYQNLYKKILQFYYAHPKYKLALYISGPSLDYIHRKHPEYTTLLRELINRKQVEMLGGGYYNPAFPLLFQQDRTGQLELMTQTLRSATGKRPRGVTLVNSIWDSSIINCLTTCGMEYSLLDSSLIPQDKNEYLPLIVCEQGKTLKILPVYREDEPAIFDDMSPENYIAGILKNCKKNLLKSAYETDLRGLCLNINENLYKHLFNSGWIESFYQAIENQYTGKVQVELPSDYISQTSTFVPSYISAGIRSDVAQWGKVPFAKSKLELNDRITIQQMLLIYRQNKNLYNRMLYLSLLVNSAHGDKIRRKEAREKLWHAQAGEAYVCSPDGVFVNSAIRQQCYKYLTEAEKLLRECDPKGKGFEENLATYDYDGDGHNDYICRMNNFTAVINPDGAQITELDIMRNTGNYVDNLSRIEQFDKVQDIYQRGLFVIHLLTDAQFKDYKKGLPVENGVFSRTVFKQLNFDSGRNEIKLIGHDEYSDDKIPVSLRKKYIANSNGFMIQLILKNESPLPIKGSILVENNFAQSDFTSADASSYKVDIISIGESHAVEIEKKAVSTKAVSYVQVTDIANDISFVSEPNEDCEHICHKLIFNRSSSSGENLDTAGNTLVSSMAWNIDLAAGMELEKTINFTIIAPKKRRSKK